MNLYNVCPYKVGQTLTINCGSPAKVTTVEFIPSRPFRHWKVFLHDGNYFRVREGIPVPNVQIVGVLP